MVPEVQIRKALADNPQLAEAVLQAQHLPAKPGEYQPQVIEILFDGILVSTRRDGGDPVDLMLPVDYRPNVIELYGDDELLLVKAGNSLLLNRLPQNLKWSTYGTN